MTEQSTGKPQSERVDALLGQMRMLCSQIDQIGIEQQRLLDEDQLEAFVASLASRNPKIESLAQAGSLVESYLEADGLGVDQIDSARKQLDEMSSVVSGILDRDAKQQIVVEQRRDKISKQLTGVGKTKHAMRAYNGGAQRPNASYQDREG